MKRIAISIFSLLIVATILASSLSTMEQTLYLLLLAIVAAVLVGYTLYQIKHENQVKTKNTAFQSLEF